MYKPQSKLDKKNNPRILTVPVLISDEERKLTEILYFHISLCCLKRFYEGPKGLHKTFSNTTKKSENQNLNQLSF